MAYDLDTAEFVRQTLLPLLAESDTLTEIKMFGGLCFTVNTRMVAGVLQDRVLIRIPTDVYARELSVGNVSPMDFTGKPLKNFAFLGQPLASDGDALSRYLEISLAFSRTVTSGRKKRVRPLP